MNFSLYANLAGFCSDSHIFKSKEHDNAQHNTNKFGQNALS